MTSILCSEYKQVANAVFDMKWRKDFFFWNCTIGRKRGRVLDLLRAFWFWLGECVGCFRLGWKGYGDLKQWLYSDMCHVGFLG